MPFTYEYPRPAVTVDCVVFGFDADDGRLSVLLIQRGEDPFKGHLALPGGFVNVSDDGDQGESVDDAARRELKEETGLNVAHLEQLCTVGTPGRDPRGRVITVAYFALVSDREYSPRAGSDAESAQWVPLDVASNLRLAFDHSDTLAAAVKRLRAKIRYAPIGFSLLPPLFTILQLRRLYESILGTKFDPSVFYKRALNTGLIKPTRKKHRDGLGKPAALFRFDETAYVKALDSDNFHFDL
jgi:8-oxo-dGTP diphosphatase